MTGFIHHSLPTIEFADIKAVTSVLKSSQFAYESPIVKSLEKEFASFVGTKFAVAVNSGSSALHLALLALGIDKTSSVILPTYTCPALLNAVHYCAAKPILSDIEIDTYNISFPCVKKCIRKDTKTIIVPHMFGLPASLKDFKTLGLPIVEDCAMAIGAKIGRKRLGSFGDVSVVSFYATKVLTTGMGGIVLTSRKDIYNKILDLITYDNRDNYQTRYNYGLSAIGAAIGKVQLHKLPFFLKAREKIADFYYRELSNCNWIKLPPKKWNIFYRFVIKINKDVDTFIRYMHKNGIECKRPVYKPLHHYFPRLVDSFPAADEVYKTLVSIPIYPSLKPKDAKRIVSAIKNI
jgi:dTDP-4-amino-4,6-dideoxygalactose transaminase